jgi:hypothetical protein
MHTGPHSQEKETDIDQHPSLRSEPDDQYN